MKSVKAAVSLYSLGWPSGQVVCPYSAVGASSRLCVCILWGGRHSSWLPVFSCGAIKAAVRLYLVGWSSRRLCACTLLGDRHGGCAAVFGGVSACLFFLACQNPGPSNRGERCHAGPVWSIGAAVTSSRGVFTRLPSVDCGPGLSCVVWIFVDLPSLSTRHMSSRTC